MRAMAASTSSSGDTSRFATSAASAVASSPFRSIVVRLLAAARRSGSLGLRLAPRSRFSSPPLGGCAWDRSLQDRNRLERDLFVLGLDPEPDRLAAVLLLQVRLAEAQLGGEALEGHALDVLAERLARRDVLVVHAPEVLRLGLAGQRNDLGVVRDARARGRRLVEHHLRRLALLH